MLLYLIQSPVQERSSMLDQQNPDEWPVDSKTQWQDLFMFVNWSIYMGMGQNLRPMGPQMLVDV